MRSFAPPLSTFLFSLGLLVKPPLLDSLELQAGVCVKEGGDERQGPAFEEVWEEVGSHGTVMVWAVFTYVGPCQRRNS